MLLSHGKAVQALRAEAPGPINVGAAPVGVVRFPETDTPADIEAARKGTFAITEDTFWNNTWYADPWCSGTTPKMAYRFGVST